MGLIFSLICGGLALRSAARTHQMLKPEQFLNRPMFLHRSAYAPILAVAGFWITLGSAAMLGWHYIGWPGIILRPVEVAFASLLLDFVIERALPLRLRHSFLFNPIH